MQDAAEVVNVLAGVVGATADAMATRGRVDEEQALLYDLAHAASSIRAAESSVAYGERGELEAHLANVFVADAARATQRAVWAAEAAWGVGEDVFDTIRGFVARWSRPDVVAEIAFTPGDRHLDRDFALVADTFRRFAAREVAPLAEAVHRDDLDVPESIIDGLAAIGGFGLSIPAAYGGGAVGGESDLLAMVVATEELSTASLAIGGSLITRPEIVARAIDAGGTESQKQEWLPRLASGEVMAAVSVTEPDRGSDVAGLTVSAASRPDGWALNGVKTWSTFAGRADVLMVLARTEPDPTHRGLSLLLVPKERVAGHAFDLTQTAGGRMQGRAIPTIGYRGMHSFEISFEDWVVPADHLIGEENGRGRGFYLQMAGFENGRLQTAARAVGVMQAAYDHAAAYTRARHVFGRPLADYPLTQTRLGRMAGVIQAMRQFSYDVAGLLATGDGATEAAMVKASSTRAAEWITRDAMQMHGGFGYAEEYPVSRLFVDARVLSIFEGSDETLALRLIGRRLLGDR